MSTVTRPLAAAQQPGPPLPATSLPRVLLSEWTKLRSLRSTVFSLLAAVLFVLGLAILVPSVIVAHWPPRDPRDALGFDPVGTSLAGVFLAQLAVGTLGVLFMTGEYATGMIRATFAAVPARLPVLGAKALVFGATTLVLMVPAVVGAFSIGQLILRRQSIDTGLDAPGVARAVVGAGVYLALVGLLGLALGALLRSTAAGICALFGLLFVLPIIVHFLPSSWSDPTGRFLPSNAGQAFAQVRPDPSGLSPWTGLAVFCAYVAGALVAAAVAMKRRDA